MGNADFKVTFDKNGKELHISVSKEYEDAESIVLYIEHEREIKCVEIKLKDLK